VRPFAVHIICALICLAAAPALAEPLPALRAAPNELASPGDPTWPLGPQNGGATGVVLHADDAVRTPEGLQSFRAELPGDAKPGPPRACLGLASATRRDLYKTRAVEFTIKASRPVAGLVIITSSNTENPKARDRFFGAFGIGTQWKTLRLPFGSLAPLPGWPEEAARQGFAPGDLVLRPDSVEDICIGAEAGRIGAQGVSLWVGGVRFVR